MSHFGECILDDGHNTTEGPGPAVSWSENPPATRPLTRLPRSPASNPASLISTAMTLTEAP